MKDYMLIFHDKFNFEEDFDSDITISFRLSDEFQKRGTCYEVPQDLYDKVRNWATLVTWDASIDESTLVVYNINTKHRPAFEKLLER